MLSKTKKIIKNSHLTKYFLGLVLIGIFVISISASAFSLKDSFSADNGLSRFAANSGYTNQDKTPEYYIGLLLTAFFSILGIISVALLIYSGFTWMTARGNEAKVEKAKSTITEVLIGLIFIIGGYALTTFILKIFS